MRKKIGLRALCGIAAVLLLLVPNILDVNGISIPGSGFIDEIITIVMICYAAVRWSSMENGDKAIVLCFAGIAAVGLLSNCFSGVDRQAAWIFSDILLLSKTFFAYLGMKQLASDGEARKRIIRFLSRCALVLIPVMFALGTANLVFDIGMSKGHRFGIRSFSFIFNQPAHCGLFAGMCLAFLILSEPGMKSRRLKIWTAMGVITMFYTTKGMAMIIAAAFLALEIMTKKRKKIQWYHIALVMLVAVPVLSFQIRYYILDPSAPRARLIYYGLETAKRFFPLGSGFATYGSEMAARYYSPLYVSYGFDSLDGLASWSSLYLNDNYMATILGETGFIGLGLHLYALAVVFRQIIRVKPPCHSHRSIAIAFFASLASIFVASGAYKTYFGMVMFMILGLYTAPSAGSRPKGEDDRNERTRQHYHPDVQGIQQTAQGG